MVSILLCGSLPIEKCFKAELELLVMDEKVDFQSRVAVELATPVPKDICIL